jgi:hypothetical protein
LSFVREAHSGLRVAIITGAAIVAAGLSSACDNVTNPNPPGVDTLYAQPIWSGTVASDGNGNYSFFDSSDVAVGDLDGYLNGETVRGLVMFDVAAYPTTDTVATAVLRVDECAVVGAPFSFADSNPIVVDHLGPQPPSIGLYAGGATGTNLGTISDDTISGYHSLRVDSAAQHDITAGQTYSSWRLRFLYVDGNHNGVSDFVAFRGVKNGVCTGNSTRLPALIITTK